MGALANGIERIAYRLVIVAARRSPHGMRARLEEEWLAHAQMQSDAPARLWFALGCCRAVLVIARERESAEARLTLAPARYAVLGLWSTRRRVVVLRENAMAMTLGSNSSELRSDINMTPLIDVMLVLLIIFIITIPIQTNAIKIDNPSAARAVAPLPEVIDLSVDFDGRLSWNGRVVDRAGLQAYIARASVQRPQPQVHIRVDRFAKYEIVAQTLADLQSRGVTQIGFVDNAYR